MFGNDKKLVKDLQFNSFLCTQVKNHKATCIFLFPTFCKLNKFNKYLLLTIYVRIIKNQLIVPSMGQNKKVKLKSKII
jgi:hypothetical protein